MKTRCPCCGAGNSPDALLAQWEAEMRYASMCSGVEAMDDEFENLTWDICGPRVNITHWQPLPEPIPNSTNEQA